MPKSVRVNLSVPKPLYDVFLEMGDLTGQGVTGAMVQALALQSAYARRWIQHFNFVPREARGTQIEDRAGVVVGPIPPPLDPEFEDGGPTGTRGLSRQQRRQMERQDRKRRR